MLNKINKDFTYYKVVTTPRCILEDGKYQTNRDETPCGYAVVNLDNGIVEVTAQNLPNAVFNADYLDKAVASMLGHKEDQIEIDYEAHAGQLM